MDPARQGDGDGGRRDDHGLITLASAVELLFPVVDQEELLARVVDVLWTQHGGSGLGITWAEAWELEWDELIALIEEIDRRRAAEVKALKAANAKASRSR